METGEEVVDRSTIELMQQLRMNGMQRLD
jgi:hypothetical protein